VIFFFMPVYHATGSALISYVYYVMSFVSSFHVFCAFLPPFDTGAVMMWL